MTRRRVSTVPELITPLPSDGAPQFARWRLQLAEPASVRTRSGEHRIREAFVHPTQVGRIGVILSTAGESQPAATDMRVFPVPELGEKGAAYPARAEARRRTITLQRRVDSPVRLEPISIREN